MKKNYSSIILLFVIVLTLSGCQKSPDMNQSISDSQIVLGTVISIQIFGSKDENLLKESFDIIKDIEAKMSLNISDSEIVAINNAAGHGPVAVSQDTFYVIQKSIEYSALSDGQFDVTMEPVIGLWGIGTDEARIPEENELEEALSYVDYQKIQLDEAEQTVYLEEGMAIDLGAIAKGYAADQVAAYLKDQGITKSIINLGGNVMLIGQKDEDTLFKVGLQDPYDVRNKYFGIIEEADKTIVTSGVYERNFEEDGVLYHHILSPEDGYPVRNNIGAVSVVAETSIDADALSTVLFAVGKEKGLELVETLEGVECIYIMENHEIFTSSGIDENALTLINTDYSFSK